MSESAKENDNSLELEELFYHRIMFRESGRQFTALTSLAGLERDVAVMVETDHGLEPALVKGGAPIDRCVRDSEVGALYRIKKIAGDEENQKYLQLEQDEYEAFGICNRLIEKHKLSMNLIRVERFYNGSKIIFYFTAENRVDFRALVKDLVQEFRTRVEMRQVGVRHETKMLGGIGTCGRELCCCSFINKFDSVSIKMAKEQDLPLNPAKISGLCNRLLCCLTYEYDTYRKKRRKMPKPGRKIRLSDEQLLVRRQLVLQDRIVAVKENGEEVILDKDQWRTAKPVKREGQEKSKTAPRKESKKTSDKS